MSLHSRNSRSRGSNRSSSQSSFQTQSSSPMPSTVRNAHGMASPVAKPPTAHYSSPGPMIDDSTASASVGFETKLNKMLARVCHTSGGSLRYDKNLIGGARDEDGLNGLSMLHEYYSALQNIAEKGNGGEFTFAEVMAANSTLSVAEFSKFLIDMAPFRLPTVALTGIFQMMNVEEQNSNHGGGTLDDDDNAEDEMHFEEFMKAIVCVAVYCYSDTMSHKDAVRALVRELMLDQPYALRDRIKVLARTCAGFGAWKAPADEMEKRPLLPAKRRPELLTDILPPPFSQEMKDLVELLQQQSPAIPKVHTVSFPGPYIALSVPVDKTAVRTVRCFVSVRNMGERSRQVWYRVNGLSWLNMKMRGSCRVLGCGMSMMAEVFFDVCDAPAGEHLGGFQVMSGQDMVYEVPLYFSFVKVAEKSQTSADTAQRGGDMGKAALAAVKLCNSSATAELKQLFDAIEEQEFEQQRSASKDPREADARGKILPASFANAFKAGGFLNKNSAENLTQCVLKMQSSMSHVDVMDFLNVRLPQLLKSGRDKLNGSKMTNVAALQTSEKEEAEELALKNGLCVVSTVNSPVPAALTQHFGNSRGSPSKLATPASVKLPAIVQLRGILRNSPA